MATAGNKRPPTSAGFHPIDSPPPPASNDDIGNELPPSGSAGVHGCLREFCRVMLLGVVALMVFGSVCYFYYGYLLSLPSDPWWPYIHINSLSVAVNSSPSDEISGNRTAHITVVNKDRDSYAVYDSVHCHVQYRGEWLARTRLPAFELAPKSEKKVTVTLAASGLYADDWVVRDMDAAGISHGSLKFDLWFTAGVHPKGRGGYIFESHCDDLPVMMSSSREMVSGVCSHDCNGECYIQ